jgi:hypothetical protein
VAAAPAERPSWPRSRGPSLGQSAAVAARLGHGLPPATVDRATGGRVDVEDLDAGGPPVCPACGHQHETPSDLPSMARSVVNRPGDSAALACDGFGPPGWGRRRGGDC